MSVCFPPRMNRSEGGVEVVGSPGAGFVFFCCSRALSRSGLRRLGLVGHTCRRKIRLIAEASALTRGHTSTRHFRARFVLVYAF